MRDAKALAPVLVANGGEAEAIPWVKSKADVDEMLMKMKNWSLTAAWVKQVPRRRFGAFSRGGKSHACNGSHVLPQPSRRHFGRTRATRLCCRLRPDGPGEGCARCAGLRRQLPHVRRRRRLG